MRALIVGAGAVGQYLAARLRLGGHDVVLFARPKIAALLKDHGVTLRVGNQAWPFSVVAAAGVEDSALAAPFELVIVATKSWATLAAAETIRAIRACDESSIMTVQNGLGNEEALAGAFGADRVVAGVLTTAVDRLDPTTVFVAGKGGLSFAPMGAAPHNWILASLAGTGLVARAAGDWKALKWSKLCINLMANAVCAILDWKPAQVYGSAEAFEVERRCLLEAVATMRDLGLAPVNLVDFPVPLLAAAVRRLPPSILRVVLSKRVESARGDKLPSLLLDLRSGRTQLEVDALNGAVAERARAIGVSAPANATVSFLLDGIARREVNWTEYRGKPEALAASIDKAAAA